LAATLPAASTTPMIALTPVARLVKVFTLVAPPWLRGFVGTAWGPWVRPRLGRRGPRSPSGLPSLQALEDFEHYGLRRIATAVGPRGAEALDRSSGRFSVGFSLANL